MDTITLTTPSNYVVTLKKSLSYRHHLAIQDLLMGDTSMKMGDKTNVEDAKKMEIEVSFRNINAYRQKALEYLVIKVIDPDKSEADNAFEAVMEMEVEDAEAVADKVSEILDSKKKSKTSS